MHKSIIANMIQYIGFYKIRPDRKLGLPCAGAAKSALGPLVVGPGGRLLCDFSGVGGRVEVGQGLS